LYYSRYKTLCILTIYPSVRVQIADQIIHVGGIFMKNKKESIRQIIRSDIVSGLIQTRSEAAFHPYAEPKIQL
jgi:hypothetical protein